MPHMSNSSEVDSEPLNTTPGDYPYPCPRCKMFGKLAIYKHRAVRECCGFSVFLPPLSNQSKKYTKKLSTDKLSTERNGKVSW